MKIIVTHHHPDTDAITSVWLIKKFLPQWQKAMVTFVPAGKTLNDAPPDKDPNILHVDTGLGKLDHHQTKKDTCAAKLTLSFIKKQPDSKKTDKAIDRLVKVVNDIDHFREVFYPQPLADFYAFFLACQIDGWRVLFGDNDQKILRMGMKALEGVYAFLKLKIKAEREIKKAYKFKTKWGKALAIEASNDEVIRLAQKQGFKLAIRKDPRKGYVKIKARPEEKIDLSKLYKKLKKEDSQATWFLHVDKKQLLNGSTKNPKMRPTTLTLEEIIKIVKAC